MRSPTEQPPHRMLPPQCSLQVNTTLHHHDSASLVWQHTTLWNNVLPWRTAQAVLMTQHGVHCRLRGCAASGSVSAALSIPCAGAWLCQPWAAGARVSGGLLRTTTGASAAPSLLSSTVPCPTVLPSASG